MAARMKDSGRMTNLMARVTIKVRLCSTMEVGRRVSCTGMDWQLGRTEGAMKGLT